MRGGGCGDSLSIPVADYQRDEDAMKRGRDMPPCKESDCGANPQGGEGETFVPRYEKN